MEPVEPEVADSMMGVAQAIKGYQQAINKDKQKKKLSPAETVMRAKRDSPASFPILYRAHLAAELIAQVKRDQAKLAQLQQALQAKNLSAADRAAKQREVADLQKQIADNQAKAKKLNSG